MFCPNCGAEYVEGVAECSDCRVALVAERPAPKEFEKPRFENVLTIFNVGDMAVIKSVFDAENIEYVFDGENFNLVDPMIQPVRLFVKSSHAARAKELLGGMSLHYWSASSTRDDAQSEK